MSDRFYSVLLGSDNLMARIMEDDSIIVMDAEKEYIKEITSDFIVLYDVVSMINMGDRVGLISFKELAYGSKFVTINSKQISQIYLPKDEMVKQARGILSGLKL